MLPRSLVAEYNVLPDAFPQHNRRSSLCVSRGRAKLCFGGDQNPDRVETILTAGDVMIVPAGVAHRLLDDLDGGFKMVGRYLPGLEWDIVLPPVAMTRQGPILGM